VERFLTAATDAGVVVADVVETATGGRTTDPAGVYVSEVAALRDALSRAAAARERAGDGEQISPSPDATVEGGDG
jgi:hypothetical protein